MESGGQVDCAHRLGHADSDLAGRPGIAVGHVGGRLFAVCNHALDSYHVHLGQTLAEHCRHEEHVGNPIGFKGIGQILGPSHPRHDSPSQTPDIFETLPEV